MSDHKPLLHQRMWAALKSRDWFGVGIEVFAVVLGVLLGLQASQWADERKEAKERAELVDRLVEDLTIYGKENLELAETRQARLDKVIVLAKAVEGGRVDALDRQTLLDALDAVQSFDDARPLPLTFVELVESGSLARVEDGAVRERLENLARNHSRFLVAADMLNDEGFRYSAVTSLWQYVPATAYENLEYEPVDRSEVVIDLPDLSLPANREILSAAMRRDYILLRYDQYMADRADKLVKMLEGADERETQLSDGAAGTRASRSDAG